MTSSSSLPGTITYSDADIAGIIRTANQGEVDQGQVAIARANSDEVRAFARMMVSDHSQALTQANDLFSRINVTPNDFDLTGNLKSNSQQTVSNLNTYSGADFDQKYIQSQIDAHQWLLNSLDSTLISSAHNRQLAPAKSLPPARRLPAGPGPTPRSLGARSRSGRSRTIL